MGKFFRRRNKGLGNKLAKSVVKKAREFPWKGPKIFDWVGLNALNYLGETIKPSGHRLEPQEKRKKSSRRPPVFKFPFSEYIDSGDFSTRVFTNTNAEKPITKKFTRTIGKKSKVMIQAEKEFGKPNSMPLEDLWIGTMTQSKRTWDNFTCCGFNRKGVAQRPFLKSQKPERCFYDCLGTSFDMIASLVSITGTDPSLIESFISNDQFPTGSYDIYVPIKSMLQKYIWMNANEFTPMYMQVYICSPRQDMPLASEFDEGGMSNHPAHSWFNPVKLGTKYDSTEKSTRAGEEMDYQYGYPPTYDLGDPAISDSTGKIIETSVVFGATPFFSKKFTDRYNVHHVYQVRLLPQQKFELELELIFQSMQSLQDMCNPNKFFKQDTTLVPLVTFYGESVVAMDTERKSVSPIDKVLEGTGPCMLLSESKKSAKTIGSPHLWGLASPSTTVHFNMDSGMFAKSRTLAESTYSEIASGSYCQVNTNLLNFNKPYYFEKLGGTPVYCSKKFEIKVTTEESIKESGSISSREK